jgi:hypothetical protein
VEYAATRRFGLEEKEMAVDPSWLTSTSTPDDAQLAAVQQYAKSLQKLANPQGKMTSPWQAVAQGAAGIGNAYANANMVNMLRGMQTGRAPGQLAAATGAQPGMTIPPTPGQPGAAPTAAGAPPGARPPGGPWTPPPNPGVNNMFNVNPQAIPMYGAG